MAIALCNTCKFCYRGEHRKCNGMVDCDNQVRQCDCTCRHRPLMSNKYLVLTMAIGGCISASSIKDRLKKLDSYTDKAVEISQSRDCKSIPKPFICPLADTCLLRSLFSASSCKAANDAAASEENADVQFIKDRACKQDLDIAEQACNKMMESKDAAPSLGNGKDGSNDSLSRDLGNQKDSGIRPESRD